MDNIVSDNNIINNMTNSDIKDIVKEKINEADMILIGIGEEFGESLSHKLKNDRKYAAIFNEIEKQEERQWLIPYMEKVYGMDEQDKKMREAYEILEKLVADKNYFIVTSRTDDMIFRSKLREDRIVAPCGGYHFLQCENGCEEKLYEIEEELLEGIQRYMETGQGADRIEAPMCPVCGKKLVFNNVKAANYLETGYLEQWNNYTRWLQGTVNKKLCVLELGVGMQYPTVIRWPFEKVVFFNQKSCLFRIHSKLYQVTEEIKDRSYKVKEKPIDFLINGFV